MNIKDFLPLPDLLSFKHILFVQPHPDDNEIGAGGTIALCTQKGIQVSYLTVSKGKGGSETISSDDLAQIRQKELREAGQCLGVKDFRQLDIEESHYPNEKELVEGIVKVIRELKPDCVVTVDPTLLYEAHPTHRKVGQAVLDACLFSGNNHFLEGELKSHKVHCVAFYASAHPNTIIDITSTYALKLEAIQKHQSQFDELGFAQLKMYLDYRHHENGKEKNFAFAESFKVLPMIVSHMMVESESY